MPNTVLQRFVLRGAKFAIRHALFEYLRASAYYRDIGAQTPSVNYGGSRSMIYYQMTQAATSTRELRDALRQYRGLHTDEKSNHDELGGFLRIAGYRLRKMPRLGKYLEKKVREDDTLMAQANFKYPDGLERISAPIEPPSWTSRANSQHWRGRMFKKGRSR